MIELWSYYRSGTSHRVRIALNVKGLDWQHKELNLLQRQHQAAPYQQINPQGLAPTLIIDGKPLTQSPAILEFLEETWPEPALLPKDLFERAQARAMAMIIGCDIHPINNLRVLNEVKRLTATDGPPIKWIHNWLSSGFAALESLLANNPNRSSDFCFGTKPSLVECYLIPQVYAAKRFQLDMKPYPVISQIDDACAELAAFIAAHPDNQPDAPKSGE